LKGRIALIVLIYLFDLEDEKKYIGNYQTALRRISEGLNRRRVPWKFSGHVLLQRALQKPTRRLL
jgi:hypothetical protein